MRQKMRECFDELWILDLEGGNLGARRTENVFAIQTPVAIAIGVRYDEPQPDEPAVVRYAKIIGTRQEKLEKLEQIRSFEDIEWRDCFHDWMQPFLPEGEGDYFAWPLLTDVFPWQHSGVQFKRTWPIGETREVLHARWNALLELDVPARRAAFRETGARRIDRQYPSLENPANRLPPISTLSNGAGMVPPVRYAFRSFDRQWVLADPRVSDRLRTVLWQINGPQQLYMTSLLTGVLGVGPAATVSSYVPDLHHFRGSFGGKDVIPLWRDAEATQPNITHDLLEVLGSKLGQEVNPEDLFCYCYALLASPAYVEKFSEELTTPGPRIPITRDPELFHRAVELGRTLVWLHTYGERFVPAHQRRGRLPQGRARNTVGVPTNEEHYPETFSYDPDRELLRVGTGEFYPVAPDVWDFSVSGYRVLESWLSYRRKAGYGRTSSPLDHIRPSQWTAALRDELLNLIWVLEATVERFPELEEVFSSVIVGPTFAAADLPEPEAEERQAPAEEEEAPRTEQDVLPY